MNFDISMLDTRTRSEAGVPMPILNPRSGAPFLGEDLQPVTITLLGPNSNAFRAANRELQQRRADYASRNVKMGADDFERERFDMLVALTKGWSFDAMGGQPFPFSPDNVKVFWADKRWEWVQLQAWAWTQQDGNYLPNG